MRDHRYEMRCIVAAFVDRVATLALRAVIETLEAALDPRHTEIVAQAPVQRVPGRRDKRTAAQLEQLAASLATFVQRNPGLRIEQINSRLGTTTAELALPLRKLIAHGLLHTKGVKRSTKYYPAEVGPVQPMMVVAEEHVVGSPARETNTRCSA